MIGGLTPIVIRPQRRRRHTGRLLDVPIVSVHGYVLLRHDGMRTEREPLGNGNDAGEATPARRHDAAALSTCSACSRSSVGKYRNPAMPLTSMRWTSSGRRVKLTAITGRRESNGSLSQPSSEIVASRS